MNSIARMNSTPSTTVAYSRRTDDECSSLFEDTWRLTQALRFKPGLDTLGLEARVAQMFRDGVAGGREKFLRHVNRYNKQQDQLNRAIDEWEDDDCDQRKPPSNLQAIQIAMVYEWAGVRAPSWDEIKLGLGKSKAQFEQATGQSAGLQPTSEPISVPWRRIAIGAAEAFAAPVIIAGVALLIIASATGNGGGGQYA